MLAKAIDIRVPGVATAKLRDAALSAAWRRRWVLSGVAVCARGCRAGSGVELRSVEETNGARDGADYAPCCPSDSCPWRLILPAQ